MITKNLISPRYKNDGISLVPLSLFQKKTIAEFLADRRIGYTPVSSCPLCHSNEFLLIAEKDRYGIPLDTVMCICCGLIFSSKFLTSESEGIFYAQYYRKIYEGILAPSKEYYLRQYAFDRKRKMEHFIASSSVVVEIGCGGGWNLLPYAKRNISHFGFDFDDTLINFGKKEFGLNLFTGGVEQARNMGIKADFVFLLQVLEHSRDPIVFLRDVAGIMKDGAVLKISVPSLNTLIFCGDTTGYDLLGTLQNAHNFLFDEWSLAEVVKRAGLEVRVNLGGHLVASKGMTSSECNNTAAVIPKKRGKKVLNFLRFCDCMVGFKNRFIPDKLKTKLHGLYYFLKPYELCKYLWFIKR